MGLFLMKNHFFEVLELIFSSELDLDSYITGTEITFSNARQNV